MADDNEQENYRHHQNSSPLKKRTVKLNLNLMGDATPIQAELMKGIYEIRMQQNEIVGAVNNVSALAGETKTKLGAVRREVDELKKTNLIEAATLAGETRAKNWMPILFWIFVTAFVGVLVLGLCAFLFKVLIFMNTQQPGVKLAGEVFIDYLRKSVE